MLNSIFIKPRLVSKSLSLVLLLLLWHSTSQAQESVNTSWYQIEYIIFQHLKTDAHILRYEDTPYPKQQDKQFSHLVDHPQPMSPFQFSKLDSAEMSLAEALDKLSRRRDIKLLDHGAWQQELASDESTPPLKIAKPISNKTRLFGELQIKKSRFTHAEFSLYMADSLLFPFADTKDWFFSPQKSGTLIDLLLPLPESFNFTQRIGEQELYFNILHLQESRRIKQDEVHYLDHPVLGVIVTINEIEAPAHAFISIQ